MQGVAEVASQSHKLKVGGSIPSPASKNLVRFACRNQFSGCIVSPVRRPILEVGGRKFKSCHPDHL